MSKFRRRLVQEAKVLKRRAGGSEAEVKLSVNQEAYLDGIGRSDVVLCVGPAGTGKTFLAVLAALRMLRSGEVEKIILCRPAVQSGEDLGHLPGDVSEKVDPYLRPLYDALSELAGRGEATRMVRDGVVEVVPLAFMRGRTFNRSAMVLDEAQNATVSQMRMFLTRMGRGSKVIVNGDVTQVDLEGLSGLRDALETLKGVPGVHSVSLRAEDIVRHPVVCGIIEAYDSRNRRRA